MTSREGRGGEPGGFPIRRRGEFNLVEDMRLQES